MKKVLTKQERDAIINRAIEQVRRLRVSLGPIETKKITAPTVTVMDWKDVKSFNQPGLKIAYAIHFESTKNVTDRLKRFIKLNEKALAHHLLEDTPRTARRPRRQIVNMRDVRRGRAINPGLIRLLGGTVCHLPHGHGRISDFDVEKDFDDDGTPVIVVIRSDDEIDVPDYKMKHVRRSEWKKKQKNKNLSYGGGGGGDDDAPTHKFLMAPLYDQMLIEAMKKVDQEMTDGKHVNRHKWKDNEGFHEKEFNNCSLLVCLFFYVYLQELYVDTSFYSNKKAFFDYCEGRLGKGFNLKTYRSFFKNIEKLQWRKDSFDEYMKGRVSPDPDPDPGLANLYFWRELYLKASRYFKEILTPTVKE